VKLTSKLSSTEWREGERERGLDCKIIWQYSNVISFDDIIMLRKGGRRTACIMNLRVLILETGSRLQDKSPKVSCGRQLAQAVAECISRVDAALVCSRL